MNRFIGKRNKKNEVRITWWLFELAFTSMAQQINFSGSWKSDTANSTFVIVPPRAATQVFEVYQNKKELAAT